MADKEDKKEVKKTVLERVYNVPLRKGWLKAPKYKRAKKAVKTLREFLQKHMKSDEVRIGKEANELIWERGIKNPPHHIKVTVTKDDDGIVRAELEGFEYKEAVKAKAKEEKATGLKGKLQDAVGKIKEEDKKEEAKEEKKVEEKEEKPAKEEKKETPAKKPAKKKATPKKAPAKKKTTTKKKTSKK
ncbi:MAG: 50S ribosomal protein L31e [archaeon]